MLSVRKDFIKFEQTVLNLGEQIVVPVPFVFKGKNTTDNELEVEVFTGCGCTEVKYNEIVKPNEDFEITGTFTKTAKTNHTKTIEVKIKTDKDKQIINLMLKVKLI